MKPRNYLLMVIAFLSILAISQPSLTQVASGDVAPLGNRDGIVNAGNALVILRKALGLVSWPIPATLESIALTPEDASLAEGNTLQFTAIGI